MGYCLRCYAILYDPPTPKVVTTCIACGATIRVFKGTRYCRNHLRLRDLPSWATTTVVVDQVKFSPPEPEELLAWASQSIKILRPDGTLDDERTKIERGKWLTRKLQGPWDETA